MLNRTFHNHPLLSKLNVVSPVLSNRYGLYETDLLRDEHSNYYKIKEAELVKIFRNACQKSDIADLKTILDFDYEELSNLDTSNPFHITESPLFNKQVILDGICLANLSENKEASLCLQQHVKPWIIDQLEISNNLLNSSVCSTLSAIAKYQPDLAYARLKNDLSNGCKITELIHNNAYELLVNALESLAYESKYFEFSANNLLSFAAEEMELHRHADDKIAYISLINLFRNACASTKVNLKSRKACLQKLLDQADKQINYNYQYVLVKLLGVTANAFESGSNNYVEDQEYESYINFSVEKLVGYAGNHDENGLNYTAEEEVHQLCKITIDEPLIYGANKIPFIIYRLSLEKNIQWNCDPIFHINHLDTTIKNAKLESHTELNKQDIQHLELRKKQLSSLFDRIILVDENLFLFLGAKKSNKVCRIHIALIDGLDLHMRQSLAERLIFSQQTNLHQIDRSWPKCTYIIANFGMVITDRPHAPRASHKRVFKTMPIKITDFSIAGMTNGAEGHAEAAVYDYFLNNRNIDMCLNNFRNHFGINSTNHKVYAIILDLHGTYDMCVSCSDASYTFQDEYRKKLIAAFPNHQLKTLSKYQNQLPVIIRYSSDRRYHYKDEVVISKQGVIYANSQTVIRHDLTVNDTDDQDKYSLPRDIKYYGANVLMHGKSNWHGFWSKDRRDQYSKREVHLESWTAFTTKRQFANLTLAQKRLNYTLLGLVDTDRDITEEISKLSLK